MSNWPNLRLTEHDLPSAFNNTSNLGILNGAPSGNQIDVDVDCPEAVVLADRFLPDTRAVFGRPGKRRSHRLYVCDDLPATQQFKDIDGAMLIELRSTGTQTLFPPSTHPSGVRLIWEEDGQPQRVAGAHLADAVARVAAGCLLARHWPAPGSRQDAALALAGGLVRLGWSEHAVTSFIEGVAQAAGDEETPSRIATVLYTMKRLDAHQPATGWPTLGELVGDRVVERAQSWLGATNCEDCEDCEDAWEPPVPLAEGPRPPFPTDVFPDWLRAYVDAVAVSTQTPPALAGMLVLSCLATACAKKVVVQLKPDWHEPVNVFTLTAMAPGERKSAVFAEVTRPISAFEAAERRRVAPRIAEAEGRRKIASHALSQAQNAAAKAAEEERPALLVRADERARELAEVEVPAMPQLITEDCTPERLVSILAEQGGRLAVMAPEGDVFDLMAGRYSANGGPNFGVYLKGHAGDDLRVDRIGRRGESVKAPALTLGLAVQPTVVSGLASQPGFRGRGLLARFLYGMPETLVGHRDITPPSIPEAIRHAYDERLTALLELPVAPSGGDGESRPQVLLLSSQAVTLFDAFRRDLEPRLGELGDFGALQDWAGKLAGAVARITGLLHLATYSNQAVASRSPISAETIARAIHLANEFLIPHALVAFAQMGADPAAAEARHLLRVLADRELRSCTKRELYQLVKGRFKSVEALEPAVVVLQRHGYIRIRKAVDRSGPGRKASPIFDVNPRWLADRARTSDDVSAQSEIFPRALAKQSPSPPHNPHNPHNPDRPSFGQHIETEDSEDCAYPTESQEVAEWAVPL
jgi:hypothetical protein